MLFEDEHFLPAKFTITNNLIKELSSNYDKNINGLIIDYLSIKFIEKKKIKSFKSKSKSNLESNFNSNTKSENIGLIHLEPPFVNKCFYYNECNKIAGVQCSETQKYYCWYHTHMINH